MKKANNWCNWPQNFDPKCRLPIEEKKIYNPYLRGMRKRRTNLELY